ncbi:MAG: leucine--tRNA ligase [Bacteroidota bacterium]
MKYNHQDLEHKWQKYWEENKTFEAKNNSEKPKFYVLDMFPYPSGAGLHVGHPLGYIASDIYSRYKRHNGFNVLHPMGYDSFGLPAEQYAIQTGTHPAITTAQNLKRYREQLDKIGFSFDWNREVRTSDPDYYKHTQWIFIQLYNAWYNNDTDKAEHIDTLVDKFASEGNIYVNAASDEDIEEFTSNEWHAFDDHKQEEILAKYRLTFLAETEVNWCPALGTVLANDEIINGVSERGGHPVERKKMMQWNMRISAYAERLLQGLENIDWTDSLKETQRNWIGKSKGASVWFAIDGHEDLKFEVFTTRPDTIFGVSYMTLAPEHELVKQITTPEYKEAVEKYVSDTTKRSERERMAEVDKVSGQFTGACAIHPFSGEKIQIWIGDYVLASYGTGAVMAVPAHDSRDHAFAKKFGLDIKQVIDPKEDLGEGFDIQEESFDTKDGVCINSDFITGMEVADAISTVNSKVEEMGIGKGKINYRLRDAVFSRQRYWGEPFPVYYVNGIPQMIEKEHLPVVLPEVEKYLPTETGEPPLGNATVWAWDTVTNKVVENQKIDNQKVFPLELNTMPGWAGSSWYFLRYMDSENKDEFVSEEAEQYWQNVDLYIGGSEHATGHLLYSRFWNKFLKDMGYVSNEEPFKKLINQGMILGTSAFVYRIKDTNKFVSKGLKDQYEVTPIHADVNMVVNNELDIEAFKNWREEYRDAEFILEDMPTGQAGGKYICGSEVEKMSKSKYNVVSPDTIVEDFGADALRLYEMFLGPLEQYKPWKTDGISGVYNFLKKLWKLYHKNEEFGVSNTEPTKDALKSLHKTIKKVREDIEKFSFNTSVSTFMIAVNELSAQKCNSREILEPLAIIIAPYAPHIAEELWSKLGHETSIADAEFPVHNEEYLKESSHTYPIMFNGKKRFILEFPADANPKDMEKAVREHEKTIAQLQGREPKKVIVVPKKIINVVG